METWIHHEILDGLSKLLCLSLERSPAADMIAGTAAAWVEAISNGRQFDEQRDRPRFRAAFVALAQTREQWPVPKHFIEVLPDIPSPLSLGNDRKPASPEVARKYAAKIKSMLGEVVTPMPRACVERETTVEQRAQIEDELRKHYAGRTA